MKIFIFVAPLRKYRIVNKSECSLIKLSVSEILLEKFGETCVLSFKSYLQTPFSYKAKLHATLVYLSYFHQAL